MKKLLSIILSLAMVLGLCACSNTAKTMDEVRACLFPAGGEKDVEAAMELLLPLAEKGEAEAQYYYGWILDQELEENDENEKESLRWYRLAMEQGYLKAYIGVSQNDSALSTEEKEEIAREAIQGGLLDLSEGELCADGFYWIGLLYEKGRGVVQDQEQP